MNAVKGSNEVLSGASKVVPKVVLLIDDQTMFHSLITDLLEGNRVIPFVSGEECLAWLKKHPQEKPDMVISDYNMPGRNGAETCREIRALFPDAKYILMSATVVENLDEVAQKNQFDGWLFKPFPIGALESLMGRLMPDKTSDIASTSRETGSAPSDS